MGVYYSIIEKISVHDSQALPEPLRNSIADEINRIKAFRKTPGYYCEMFVDTGDGWLEFTGRRQSARSIGSVMRKNRSLAIFFRYGYSWSAWAAASEDPGFKLAEYLDDCEDGVLRAMSFEFFNQADGDDSCGVIVQYGMNEDGTEFRGTAEYEEVRDIPDAEWLNEPYTVIVSAEDLPAEADPDAVNASVRRLNDTEYSPKETLDDFHNREAEAIVNQPKLETPDQRREFFEALEEARLATKGSLVFDRPEFVDNSTMNVRMLMLDLDAETGKTRFCLTKPIL